MVPSASQYVTYLQVNDQPATMQSALRFGSKTLMSCCHPLTFNYTLTDALMHLSMNFILTPDIISVHKLSMYVGAATLNYHDGSGVIHFGRFYCSGNEPNLTSCSHGVAPSYCTHNDDAGVICRGTIILFFH